MRPAIPEISVFKQAGRDLIDSFRSIVGVVLVSLAVAVGGAVALPQGGIGGRVVAGAAATLASLALLALSMFGWTLFRAPFRQRDVSIAGQETLTEEIAQLQAARLTDDERNFAIRQLEALRREYMKNSGYFRAGGPSSVPVPAHVIAVLADHLVSATKLLNPISHHSGAEFVDLANILQINFGAGDQTRTKALGQLHEDGERLFLRAIKRLSTPL